MFQPSVCKTEISTSHRSAASLYEREASHGIQVFEEVAAGQPDDDSVGRPMMHKSAEKQTTGEAVYVDDMPPIKGYLS